jgi:hypothetical protein
VAFPEVHSCGAVEELVVADIFRKLALGQVGFFATR